MSEKQRISVHVWQKLKQKMHRQKRKKCMGSCRIKIEFAEDASNYTT